MGALTEQMCGSTGCRFTDCTFQSVSVWIGGGEGRGAGEGRGGAAGYEAPALGNLTGSRGEGEGEETL